jgi:hypothetical protein
MLVALMASFFDAAAEPSAGFFDSSLLDKLLCAHEERRNVRGRLARQDLEARDRLTHLSLLRLFHGQAVTQEHIMGIVGQHGFDFLSTRFHS